MLNFAISIFQFNENTVKINFKIKCVLSESQISTVYCPRSQYQNFTITIFSGMLTGFTRTVPFPMICVHTSSLIVS